MKNGTASIDSISCKRSVKYVNMDTHVIAHIKPLRTEIFDPFRRAAVKIGGAAIDVSMSTYKNSLTTDTFIDAIKQPGKYAIMSDIIAPVFFLDSQSLTDSEVIANPNASDVDAASSIPIMKTTYLGQTFSDSKVV